MIASWNDRNLNEIFESLSVSCISNFFEQMCSDIKEGGNPFLWGEIATAKHKIRRSLRMAAVDRIVMVRRSSMKYPTLMWLSKRRQR